MEKLEEISELSDTPPVERGYVNGLWESQDPVLQHSLRASYVGNGRCKALVGRNLQATAKLESLGTLSSQDDYHGFVHMYKYAI